ncbi:MAG: SRPBCC domain-containing protein [Cognatishimia sp.]|uniref:SRPBCC family protein n=1 Tax=Cognatishimia sp. TaxID=2211648 RepID=UPI003B8C1881
MTTTDIRTDLSLSVDRVIAATPEKVFNAWLNPALLGKFMRPGPDMDEARCTTDAQEGGTYEIIMKAGDQEIPHKGTYKKIAPHSQIIFTWESAFSPAESEVTLDIRPEGEGSHIRLTHVTFYDEETRDNHQGGWTQILATLDSALTA